MQKTKSTIAVLALLCLILGAFPANAAENQNESVIPLYMIVIKIKTDAPVYLAEKCGRFTSFQCNKLDLLMNDHDVAYGRALFPVHEYIEDPTPQPANYSGPTPQPSMPVFVLYFSKAKPNLYELEKTISQFRGCEYVEWAGYFNCGR